MNYFDFSATNARQQGDVAFREAFDKVMPLTEHAILSLSPIRPKTVLGFCRICKSWDEVTKECLQNECPVEELAIAAQRLLDAWDSKTPLAWQPENNRELLEGLRSALPKANA